MNVFKQYSGLRREMYVLFFGRIVTNLGSMVFPLLTLILSNKLHMDAASIASLLLFMSIAQFPTIYIAGYLADHYNKRNIIIICDFITVACYFLAGMIPLSMITVGLLFIASLFATVEHPVYDALVADLSSYEDREKAYSLSYLGMNLGLVLAPSLGGLLFANYLNVAFLIDAISTLLSTILIFIFIKDISVTKSTNGQDFYEESEEENSVFKVLKARKAIVYFMICSMMIQIVYSQFNFLMPLNFERLYGEQGAFIFGTITSVNAFVVIFATPILTTVSEKLKDLNKIVVGVLLMTIGFGMYIFIQGIMSLYYVSIIIFTLGEIYNTLGSQPYLTRRIPVTHRGRISSVRNIFTSLSVAIVQNGVGFLIDHHSMIFMLIVITIVGCLTVGMVMILRIIDKKDYPRLYEKTYSK